MSNKRVQFSLAIGVVLLTLSWLAYSGVRESKTYYVTVKELQGMGPDALSKRLRVGGNVAPGSIKRAGKTVEFTLIEQGNTMKVRYTGTSPLPDTFVDNSQALADGRYTRDGVFEASQIQAKCASKYEAQKPGAPSSYEAQKPVSAPKT